MDRTHSIALLLLITTIGASYGSNCDNIAGLWRNQLGSNMTVKHKTSNIITGEYSTAVESKKGAALVSSNITGTFMPIKEGALLSFTVLFNKGKSLATWVGQCSVCDGKEVLHTSWVLRTYASRALDRWMSARINQDTFTRVLDKDQIPQHLRTMGPEPKDQKSVDCEKLFRVGEKGHWICPTGDAIRFVDCGKSGVLEGSNFGSRIVGRKDGGIGLVSVGLNSMNETTIKGWAGHIYNNELEASWIEHTFSQDCKHPRKRAAFGVHNYLFDEKYEDPAAQSEPIYKRFYKYVGSFF